ncbi:MAG TPA: creatininase family protein [Anaerolineales bacterium]|nr:creatininase family protein [Anaerolineales bacterium]
MTNYFNYDLLTWPEVAQLPRDTPLVLPLGSGYDLQRLAESLFNPVRVGLLAPFPFGWSGSGLEIPDSILATYVNNLILSLREDGFTRVHALVPGGALRLPTPEFQISQFNEAQKQTAPPFPADSERQKVILIPIGHTEQHGHHLPLSVDTIIIDAIAQGTTKSIGDKAFALPTMPYGVSTHRSSFAGTLNAGGRAFEDFWLAVINLLVARGFDRFYLISGHGGNTSFLVNVVKYAGERHPRIFCAAAFLHTSGSIGAAAIDKYRTSKVGGMGHAGELETSFMLHLRPDLCHMERVIDETDFVATPSYYMDWIEGGSLVANPPWDDDTKTGAYGAGSHGTAEKGRLWLEAAIEEKIMHVNEIHQQQSLRQARRKAGYGLWAKRQAP